MSNRRFKSKKFSPIGAVIEKVLHQYRPNMDQALLQVWEVWEAAVGKEVAAQARPAAFKGDMLLVHVSNSAWLHHLRYLENDLKAQLNMVLGSEKVRTLKLKIGPI